MLVDGVAVGTLEGSYGSFPCTVEHLAKPEVTLLAADEGAWYLPDCAQLSVETAQGTTATAVWEPGDDVRSCLPLVLPLRWSLKPVLTTTGVFIDR